MWSHDPVVLFLDNQNSSAVPMLAAALGLQVVVAPWNQCNLRGNTVAVRGGRSYRGDDAVPVRIPGTVSISPAAIAVLDPTFAGLHFGSELAAACDALWGHCDLVDRYRWPAKAQKDEYGGSALLTHDPKAPLGLTGSTDLARHVLTRVKVNPVAPLARSRVCAPCGIRVMSDGSYELVDGLAADCPDPEAQRHSLAQWLLTLGARISTGAAITVGQGLFPSLYGTQAYIDTAYVPDAKVLYLDPTLEPVMPQGDRLADLRRILARRRTNSPSAVPADRRVVEIGVGRACLVEGVRVRADPGFADFTVLGVGLTQYSEGGFVEVGRRIDGKATVKRGWHRKNCAERLESSGCRAGRVVAMFEVPGEPVQMLDGTTSPMALVVRGFRSTYRVKQLDPLICCMHSVQHVPLVYAHMASSAAALRREQGETGPVDDVALMRALESFDATQESLRAVVLPLPNTGSTWESLIRQVRIEAIVQYAPTLLKVIYERLAHELDVPVPNVTADFYLRWFARTMGEQLRLWREIRFLHDYHHPGISRWTPGHLYTLGENNVTLLAEFPDLDTGVFVNDQDEELIDVLQLPAEDIPVLRERFEFFHNREIEAARAVVQTVSAIMSHCYGAIGVDALASFEEAYDNRGQSRVAVAMGSN